MSFSTRGDLPEIVRNDAGHYEGDLKHYFKVVFFKAQNLQKGYHNFRHMLHVLWLCYLACIFYKGKITKRDARDLLIAAIFHDFDHPGAMGEDDLNIERAVRGFRKHILPEDAPHAENIIAIMRATQYPYTCDSATLSLLAQIIRDADMGQAMAAAWLQQVIFGLSEEWGKTPLEVLQIQPKFLANVKFCTEWGRQQFPQSQLDEKVRESQELLAILTGDEVTTQMTRAEVVKETLGRR